MSITFKWIILGLLCMSISSTLFADEISDFQDKISSIANSFRENIHDSNKCKDLANDAISLADDIEEYIKSNDLITSNVSKLNNLVEQAKGLEDIIKLFFGTNGYPTIKQFDLANQLINANVGYISKNKFCVEFIKIEIDGVGCFAALNPSSTSYTVAYVWNSKVLNNSSKNGHGSMGLKSHSLRAISSYDSDEPLYMINLTNVTCTIIPEYNKGF